MALSAETPVSQLKCHLCKDPIDTYAESYVTTDCSKDTCEGSTTHVECAAGL